MKKKIRGNCWRLKCVVRHYQGRRLVLVLTFLHPMTNDLMLAALRLDVHHEFVLYFCVVIVEVFVITHFLSCVTCRLKATMTKTDREEVQWAADRSTQARCRRRCLQRWKQPPARLPGAGKFWPGQVTFWTCLPGRAGNFLSENAKFEPFKNQLWKNFARAYGDRRRLTMFT